jgi:twitching motility two-component system response regulator PilG
MNAADSKPEVTEGRRALRIMVVDDSRTIRDTAEKYLKELGCDVLQCEDGFVAISRLKDYQPDMVFTDLNMPKLTGNNFMALMRKAEGFQKTPLMVMTSKQGVNDVALAKVQGADNYILKPLDPKTIREAVEQSFPELAFVP